MSALRGLNAAQYWITERADEKDRSTIRSLMTGPLETTMGPQSKRGDGRRRPPIPAWWGNDEDVSASNFAAMATMKR